jgi:hypothetical protein
VPSTRVDEKHCEHNQSTRLPPRHLPPERFVELDDHACAVVQRGGTVGGDCEERAKESLGVFTHGLFYCDAVYTAFVHLCACNLLLLRYCETFLKNGMVLLDIDILRTRLTGPIEQ